MTKALRSKEDELSDIQRALGIAESSVAIKAQQISELNEKLEQANVERAQGEQVLKTEVQKKSSIIDDLTDQLEAVKLAPPKPVADLSDLEAKVQRLGRVAIYQFLCRGVILTFV